MARGVLTPKELKVVSLVEEQRPGVVIDVHSDEPAAGAIRGQEKALDDVEDRSSPIPLRLNSA